MAGAQSRCLTRTRGVRDEEVRNRTGSARGLRYDEQEPVPALTADIHVVTKIALLVHADLP